MSALHLLPVAPAKMSLLVQLTGAAFLMANLVATIQLARQVSDGALTAWLAAFVLTAAYLPLNNWGLQGMEVSALSLLVTSAAYVVARQMRTDRWTWWPHVMLGVGTFVRPDMVVLFVTVVAFLFWTNANDRWRRAAIGSGMLAGCLIVQTSLRWMYYGDVTTTR